MTTFNEITETMVNVPYYHPDGDMYQIMIRIDPRSITITDMGDTNMRASIRLPCEDLLFIELAAIRNGLKYNNGEAYLSIAREEPFIYVIISQMIDFIKEVDNIIDEKI